MFLTPFCLDIGVSVGLCMSCQGCRADQASIFQSAMFVCSRIPQNKLTHRFEAPGDRATRPYGPAIHRGRTVCRLSHLPPRPDARPGAGPQSPRSDQSRGLNTFDRQCTAYSRACTMVAARLMMGQYGYTCPGYQSTTWPTTPMGGMHYQILRIGRNLGIYGILVLGIPRI